MRTSVTLRGWLASIDCVGDPSSKMRSPQAGKAALSGLSYPMLAKCISVVGLMIAASAAANAQAMRCDISQKFVCENTGCRTIPASTWAMIDVPKKSYARCDSRGCDTYEAYMYQSGAFLNIEVPGRATIAKVSTENVPLANLRSLSFHEVVTQLHAVLISFGSCKRM
jgi:hypothetical protein